MRESLSAGGTPVARGRGSLLGGRLRGSTTSEHNTTSEDSGLSAIVVGDLSLGGVDEDTSLTGTLATRELEFGRLIIGRKRHGGGGGVRIETSVRRE